MFISSVDFLSLRRVRGDPEPIRAMNLVLTDVFNTFGDRPRAPNYLVLVTRRMGNPDTVTAINKLKVLGTKIVGVGQSVCFIML